MTKKILAIGELLWDVLPDERKLGGAPANLAYRLNAMGNPTCLLTRLGDDNDGTAALNILKNHKFNTDFIQIDKQHPTGTVDVFFDEHKNPDYTINVNVAYDFIEWNEDLSKLAASVDCIVYGTLVQRSEKTAVTLHQLIDKAEKAIKFCDINLRKKCYNQQIVELSLKKANVAKLNHHEAYELGKMFAFREKELIPIVRKLLIDFQLDICLITLEHQGALVVQKNNTIYYSPGYHVKMEDPLGAGDAFSAAFLDELLKSNDIRKSLETGNLYGAIVVEQKGAMQAITKETIEKFYSSKNKRIIKEEYRKYWQS